MSSTGPRALKDSDERAAEAMTIVEGLDADRTSEDAIVLELEALRIALIRVGSVVADAVESVGEAIRMGTR